MKQFSQQLNLDKYLKIQMADFIAKSAILILAPQRGQIWAMGRRYNLITYSCIPLKQKNNLTLHCGSIYGTIDNEEGRGIMGRREKLKNLYRKLEQSRNNVSFTDLCTLAEMVGFTFDRQGGSHKIYRHKKYPGIMNFQEVKGKAKSIQIKQLLNFIDEHDLLNEEV